MEEIEASIDQLATCHLVLDFNFRFRINFTKNEQLACIVNEYRYTETIIDMTTMSVIFNLESSYIFDRSAEMLEVNPQDVETLIRQRVPYDCRLVERPKMEADGDSAALM